MKVVKTKTGRLNAHQIKVLCDAKRDSWKVPVAKVYETYEEKVVRANETARRKFMERVLKPDAPPAFQDWVFEELTSWSENQREAAGCHFEKSPSGTSHEIITAMAEDLKLALTMNPYADWEETQSSIFELYRIKKFGVEE